MPDVYVSSIEICPLGSHSVGLIIAPALDTPITHHAVAPTSEVEAVAQEIGSARLRHLLLQRGQQILEPAEGPRLPADPIEVNLGNPSRERSH